MAKKPVDDGFICCNWISLSEPPDFLTMHPTRNRSLLVLALAAWIFTTNSQASDRRFVYSYETNSYVPGSVELENWMTWKERDDDSYRFEFRHEVELGITEDFQLGIYLADWRIDEGAGESFHDFAIEGIYNLTNPNTDWIGSSLYGEVKFADEFLELEGKLLLQKNFGPFALVYNAVVETEWEEEGLSEMTGVLEQTAGISYQVTQGFMVGVEGFAEVEYEEWKSGEDMAVYLGPNFSLRGGDHWLTAAALWEMTATGEPDFQLRTIWGIHF